MNRNSLLKLQQIDFCIQELRLYLDTHPEDSTAKKLLMHHLKERDDMKETVQYTRGPLTLYDHDTRNKKWEDGPWPWEIEVNEDVDL